MDNKTNNIQNGKGDSPRNLSEKFRENYDKINWSHKNKSSKKVENKK